MSDPKFRELKIPDSIVAYIRDTKLMLSFIEQLLRANGIDVSKPLERTRGETCRVTIYRQEI